MGNSATLEMIIKARDEASAALKNIERATGGLHGKLLALTGAAAAAGGAFLSFRAIEGAINSTQELGLATEKLRRETGLSAEQSSQLLFAFHHLGMGVDEASLAMGKFSKNLANANMAIEAGGKESAQFHHAMEAVGVSVFDANGNLRQTIPVMLDIADKFHAVADSGQKTGLAMDLFGRSGKDMIPILDLGSAGIKALAAEADKLGLTLSADNLQKIKDYTFAHRDMEQAISGLKMQIGLEVMPVLTHLAEWFTAHQPQIREFINDAIKRGEQAFRDWSPVIRQTGHDIEAFGSWLIDHRAALVGAIVAIGVAFAWTNPAGAIVMGIAAIIGIIELFRTKNSELGASALELKLKLIELAETVVRVGDFILHLLLGPLGVAIDALGLLAKAASHIPGVGHGIADALNAAHDAIAKIDPVSYASGAALDWLGGQADSAKAQLYGLAHAADVTFASIARTNIGKFTSWFKDQFKAAATTAMPTDTFLDPAADAGKAAGAAAAASLVPAFVQAMAAQEAKLAEVKKIIADAISARHVTWAEVARLYEIGAVEVAQDFAAAMQGELSNIGAQIYVAAFNENQAAATKAGEEAAVAYADAFKQGMTDLQGAISAAFGSISQITSTQTKEDAQLELYLLIQQQRTLESITALEKDRAAAAAALAATQLRFAQQIAVVEADRVLAQAHMVELHRVMAALQTRLKDDTADLQFWKAKYSADEQLQKTLQASLKTAQDERAAAWAILGQGVGGGAMTKTLSGAATDLKDLQSQMIAAQQRGAAAGTVSALAAQLAAAQAAFTGLDAAAAANINTVQGQIDAQAAKLVLDQHEIDLANSRILFDTLLIHQEQHLVDLTQARIDADTASIGLLKTLEANQVAHLQARIDKDNAAIKVIQDFIKHIQDEIAARAAAKRIMELQLELSNGLLVTDAELAAKIREQIALGVALKGVYDDMRDHALTAKDALIAMNGGLYNLAALILQIVANPGLGSLLPGGAGGGGVAVVAAGGGAMRPQTIYIQNVTLQGEPKAALAALTGGL